MDYKILPRTFQQAKLLGLVVKPSMKKTKKIDVYKDDKLIGSVGGKGYKDYAYYLKDDGKKVADEKRRLYKLRHEKDRMVVGSNGWLADKLLW